MISEKLKHLIETSIISISKRENIYNLIDRLVRNEKIDQYELKDIAKDFDIIPRSFYQYYINFIKDDVENSLLSIFPKEIVSPFELQLIKQYSQEFIHCLNKINCSKYRSLAKEITNKISKDKFETWNKFWNPANIIKIVDQIANEAINTATNRYSDEIVECTLKASDSSNFLYDLNHCKKLHSMGIDTTWESDF